MTGAIRGVRRLTGVGLVTYPQLLNQRKNDRPGVRSENHQRHSLRSYVEISPGHRFLRPRRHEEIGTTVSDSVLLNKLQVTALQQCFAVAKDLRYESTFVTFDSFCLSTVRIAGLSNDVS